MREKIIQLAIPIFTALLCLLVWFNVILPADVFHWDESHHALYEVLITKDIQAGDWASFWADTHRQALWPFFHSWVVSVFFLFFGISYAVARSANLFIWFLALCLIYATGRSLNKERGIWTGLIAWGFAAVSLLFWNLGAENMLEALGALLTLLAFFSLLKLDQSQNQIWTLPLGLSAVLCMLTKYNYALFIYAPLAGWALYDLFLALKRSPDTAPLRTEKSKNKKVKTNPVPSKLQAYLIKYFYIFLPTLILFIWWFGGENREKKWQMILWSKQVTVDSQHQIPGFLNNLTFYFKSLIYDYNYFILPGTLLVIGMFGIWFWAYKKDPVAIKLAFFSWIPMILSIFLIKGKEHRFILTFVPLIFLTSAYFYVLFWAPAKKYLPKLLLVPMLLLLIGNIFWQSRPLLDFFSGRTTLIFCLPKINGQGLLEVLNYFDKKIPPQAPIVCGLSMARLSPYTVYFHFCNRPGPIINLYSIPQIKFEPGMYLITLKFDKDSPFYAQSDDNNKWNDFIGKNAGVFKLTDSQYFTQQKIKAEIYKY